MTDVDISVFAKRESFRNLIEDIVAFYRGVGVSDDDIITVLTAKLMSLKRKPQDIGG